MLQNCSGGELFHLFPSKDMHTSPPFLTFDSVFTKDAERGGGGVRLHILRAHPRYFTLGDF